MTVKSKGFLSYALGNCKTNHFLSYTVCECKSVCCLSSALCDFRYKYSLYSYIVWLKQQTSPELHVVILISNNIYGLRYSLFALKHKHFFVLYPGNI